MNDRKVVQTFSGMGCPGLCPVVSNDRLIAALASLRSDGPPRAIIWTQAVPSAAVCTGPADTRTSGRQPSVGCGRPRPARPSLVVDQDVVDAPGIDSDAVEWRKCIRLGDVLSHLIDNLFDVPLHRRAVGSRYQRSIEAMAFLKGDPSNFQGRYDDAAATGSDVDRRAYPIWPPAF
jgi:hypothetical protein